MAGFQEVADALTPNNETAARVRGMCLTSSASQHHVVWQTQRNTLRLQVLRAIDVNITVLWDMTPCNHRNLLLYSDDGGKKYALNVHNLLHITHHHIKWRSYVVGARGEPS
jgi:hypothetical protein